MILWLKLATQLISTPKKFLIIESLTQLLNITKICHSINSNCVISQSLIAKYKIFHLINNFIINKLSCFNGIHEIIVVPKKKSKMVFSYFTTLWRKKRYQTHQFGNSTLCNLTMLGIALASSITSFLAINLSPSP